LEPGGGVLLEATERPFEAGEALPHAVVDLGDDPLDDETALPGRTGHAPLEPHTGQGAAQLRQPFVDGLAEGFDTPLEIGRLDELLDAPGALVEGQLQRLQPPADLLRANGVLQVAQPVGDRRLERRQPADDVVVLQRLLQAGHRSRASKRDPRAGSCPTAPPSPPPSASASARSRRPSRSGMSSERTASSRLVSRRRTVDSSASSLVAGSSPTRDCSTWPSRSASAPSRVSSSARTTFSMAPN